MGQHCLLYYSWMFRQIICCSEFICEIQFFLWHQKFPSTLGLAISFGFESSVIRLLKYLNAFTDGMDLSILKF